MRDVPMCLHIPGMSGWGVPLPERDLGFWGSYPIFPGCSPDRERLWGSLLSIQHPPLCQPTATGTGSVPPRQSMGRAGGRSHGVLLPLAH